MSKPSRTSVYIFSFAISLAAGVFAGQQPDSPKTDSTTPKTKMSSKDTGTRNRVNDTASLVGDTDQKFMMDAAKGGMMEVQLGQTAQQKASSDGVKDFGKKMEQDHGAAGKELADLAKAKNVSLPADMGTEKNSVDKLSNLSGAAFDKAYMKAMVRDHKKDVKEFEKISSIGIDSDVKAFAAKTLPTLKEHLRMAEELQRSSSGKPAKASADSTAPSSTPKKEEKKDQ
jgi:putative membrane protein